MVNERFKVNLEEKKLLEMAKIKATKEYREQAKLMGDKEVRRKEGTIVQNDRSIEFKKAQLDANKIVELHPDFEGGKKPSFYLLNDIDELELHTLELKSEIEQIKKVAKENVDRS